MAKELPFFKFESSEWLSGNIQLLDFETQGVYINICALYWQRLGDLPEALAIQLSCKGNATALQTLCDYDIIKVAGEKICIDFLDEQIEERQGVCEQNRINAQLRWKNKKQDATAMRPHSKRNANREDKKRKENKPSLTDFINHAVAINEKVNRNSVEQKYHSWYTDANGIDGNGKKIKNWKQKLRNTVPHLGEISEAEFKRIERAKKQREYEEQH